MKLTNRYIPVLLCVMLGVFVCAQAAAESLTLDGARRLALANSRTLASLNLATESSALDERLQQYESLPSLSASASTSVSNPTGVNTSVSDTLASKATVGITQTVWSGGKNTTLEAIDKLSTGIARESARAEYFSVLDAVDTAWYNLQEANASCAAAADSLSTSELSLSIAETRLDSGALSMPDYLEAESDAEAKRTTLSQSKRDVSISSMKLSSLTGLSNLPEIRSTDFASYESLIAKLSGYSDEDALAFIASVREKTLANNPSLMLAAQTSAKAEKSVTLAAAAYFPTITASASGVLAYVATTGASDPTGSVTLAASLSLDAWKTKASVDKAEVARKQAALACEESNRTIDIDLQSAAFNCISAARSVVSSGKALDYAQKHYESKFEMYKLGSASVSDLSDAEGLVSTNTKSLISARYDFLSCLSTLRTLSACESDAQTMDMIP